MNFEQARELSFLVKWKVAECFSGPDCWCRMILPVDPIYYINPESPDVKHEYAIVDAGSLDQEIAEYIVKLHNYDYDKVQQCCRNAMKETMDSLIDINEAPSSRLPETRKIIRKEID